MKSKVTIYHSFFEEYPRPVYSYETDRTALEEIWRDNNVVDGDELPVRHQVRSLSVGDFVTVLGEAWTVEIFGWTKREDRGSHPSSYYMGMSDEFYPCGAWGPNGNVYCDFHQKEQEDRYPQGWRYYPGDVCPHGVYVGGSGIDWMCGVCEAG